MTKIKSPWLESKRLFAWAISNCRRQDIGPPMGLALPCIQHFTNFLRDNAHRPRFHSVAFNSQLHGSFFVHPPTVARAEEDGDVRTDSLTIVLTWNGLRSAGVLRVKLKIFLTTSLARNDALLISARQSFAGFHSGISSIASSVYLPVRPWTCRISPLALMSTAVGANWSSTAACASRLMSGRCAASAAGSAS